MVKYIIRLEGLAVFITAVYFYHLFYRDWLAFALLLLIPDISMVGYFINKKLGALFYNLVHNYILGFSAAFFGFAFDNDLILFLGLIFLAHVGIDRFLGYGLKYPSGFKDTHIQKL
jgi:hypothetical protein